MCDGYGVVAMSWLKEADASDDMAWLGSDELTKKLDAITKREIDQYQVDLRQAENTLDDMAMTLNGSLKDIPDADKAKELVQQALSAIQALRPIFGGNEKEGSVYSDVDYQRDDLNKGTSGLFDDQGIDDKRKDQSVDPGPASATPGAATPIAPGIFDY